MAPVASRTRSKQEQMYRKLHEEIKRKNLGSSFTGFRDRKKKNASFNYNVQSMQSKKGEVRRKIINLISDSESEDVIFVEEIKPSVSDKGRTEHLEKERENTVSDRKRNVSEYSGETTAEIVVLESVSSEEDAVSQRSFHPEKFAIGSENLS